MEHYTILVLILGIAFCALLSVAISLAIYLMRKQSNGEIEEKYELIQEKEPFARSENPPSIGEQNRMRLSEFISPEEDEVFEDGVSPLSDIAFSLFHIRLEGRLVVDVWSVANTPADFICGYLEAQLFPSNFEAGQFRTNIRESVDSAVIFNESFVIPDVTYEVLTQVYLKLFLYACNGSTQGQCVGHAVFSLRNIQLNPAGKTHFKKKLIQHRICESPAPTTDDEPSISSTPSPTRDKGELYISLRYQKKSGRINVVVLKAENIQKGNVLKSDPYVKIKLLYEGEVVDKKQTKAKRRSPSTCWNEPFAFNIDEEKGMHNYELVFLVRRRDLISPNSSLGHVRIGAQVGGAGQSHWYAMMAKGNLMRQVARPHKIQ